MGEESTVPERARVCVLGLTVFGCVIRVRDVRPVPKPRLAEHTYVQTRPR